MGPLFAPLQHGVSSKAGCEKIVHRLHERFKSGHVILSIDAKNAFNSPNRADIAKHVFAFGTLRPFQRIFHAEYGQPSELLYYGSDGTLFGVIPSTCGLRQGSPLESLYYCAFLQPLLEILKQEFPDIEIYAFIDDVNMASKNSQSLAKAFVRLQEMVNAHNIELAPGKCVWFGGQEKIPIPEQLANEAVKAAYDSIKILGAHLGEDESVKSGLFQQLVRNTEAFRRLKLMGANNVSLLLLSKSMNVRHQYAIRVHEPTLSDAVSLSFDNNVEQRRLGQAETGRGRRPRNFQICL